MQGWLKNWYAEVWVPLPLPLVGQKGDAWIQWKALTAIGWGFCVFCEVKSAIFRILGLFLGMMSLGKNHLFLATLKGHSGPPPSPITLIPLFFEFLDPKIGGGGPWSQPKPGGWGRLGGWGVSPYAIHLFK